MEDFLASLIEYMPTYPLPFLVKLMKQKMGITSDEAEVFWPRTLLSQKISIGTHTHIHTHTHTHTHTRARA